MNITKVRSNLDRTDITVSLNYAYTFSLFAIKRKGAKTDAPETKTQRAIRKIIENL